MSYLPRISGRECCKALQGLGLKVDRQRGSHVTLVRLEPFLAVTVPDHPELDAGTLRAIIRAVGITVDEFKDLL